MGVQRYRGTGMGVQGYRGTGRSTSKTDLGEKWPKMLAENEKNLIVHKFRGTEGKVLWVREGGEGSHEGNDLVCSEVTLRL